MPVADLAAYAAELADLGRAHGLDAVGVASAEPFTRALAALQHRHAAGLDGGMAFTYKNPERSIDPGAAVRGARALVVGARSYVAAPIAIPRLHAANTARSPI